MRITVKGAEAPKKDTEMHLELQQLVESSVTLYGTDANGDMWNVATIDARGIQLSDGIDSSSGWALDGNGRLKLVT